MIIAHVSGLLSHLAATDGQTQQRLATAVAIHRNVMVGLTAHATVPGPEGLRRDILGCGPTVTKMEIYQ